MPASSYFKKKAFVGQRGVDGFSLGVDDISDLIVYLDSAQGKDATIRSPTYYWDLACRFMRPQDLLFGYTMRTYMAQGHDVDVFFPVVPSGIVKDDLLLAITPQEIKNKTITPETNELTGVEKFPDFAKSGKYQGNNFTGEGTMESLVHRDLPELKGDTDEGSFAQYVTSTVAESSTGFWVPNPFLTMTKFDPVVKLKVRFPDWGINTSRFFFGFVTADTVLNNDIPFGNADTATLMGFRSGDSDFKLFRGIGDGVTTVSPHSTNANIGLGVNTIEFGFRQQGTRLYYKINNGAEIEFSTNLPQDFKWLKLHCDLQNTTTDDKHLDVFWSRIESKK
jgi:hypothetical protein